MGEIGKLIREHRERLRWSQTKLATLAGISQSFLWRIETGKWTASWETYIKLAGALGISIDSLLISKSNVEAAPKDWRQIPVLSYRQASEWDIDSSAAQLGPHESIMTHLEHPPSTFAVKLRDETNAPKYQRDDVVVINPALPPIYGDMVLASDKNGDSIFGLYRDGGVNEQREQVFELAPLNTIYAPKRSDRQPLSIVGTMVEHRSYRRP